MKRLKIVLLLCLLLPAAQASPGFAQLKPNLVVILADDLGYGDVPCYHPQRGRIPTPNLDRLAAQGMRFTDAHSGELLPSRFLKATPLLASLPGPAVEGWQFEAILPALGDHACANIRAFAKARPPFLLYLPLTAPHEPIAVNLLWKGRSGLGAYADFVMETDAVVGRVLDALERSGAAENTLVVFTSDNGKAPYTGAAELEAKGHFPSGPLRGYKSSVYEGGHRVPFMVRWPGMVKPGSVCGQLAHQADLLATLADILETKLPDNAGEDSFSLLPLLKGGDRPVREHAVSCGANGVPGLRRDSWKLILDSDARAKTSVQLFNLATDLGETNNLAAAEPARVAAMQRLMEKLITDGRSTPGPPQTNDVPVRRFPNAVKITAP